MEKEKIARINELARKKKTSGLTPLEAEEQQTLYAEYLNEIRASFGATLEHTVIKRPDGTVEKVKDRKKN
ncbi:MAG: DUF896 domain-containing protein [Clostridia bacterium]|nr:DUF896 domain-containing protein [Clostridia bacterium]